MPIHDWSRINAGVYHDFHLSWVNEVKRVLNVELPADTHYALTEPSSWEGLEIVPDDWLSRRNDSVAEDDFYGEKRRRIAVFRAADDNRCAFIEFVGPVERRLGRLRRIANFVASRLRLGHNVMLIDISCRRCAGTRNVVSDVLKSLGAADRSLSAESALCCASIVMREDNLTMHSATVSDDDSIPQLPLFIDDDDYINVPLEATYQLAYANVPHRWRRVIEDQNSATH